MDDNKYIVFKRDEFMEWFSAMVKGTTTPPILQDAVVIRRQDIFSGPALHVYAANIGLVAKLLNNEGINGRGAKLRGVADYFHDQAILADEEGYKLPD